ncbi:tryptophan--tRNA ligase [Candidatus Gottesmanbacteria bacterium RBG_16_52_11]|uniref:Tryptophan--tRNA ligase n=1 Tax=Candidatus Gottesmanbacteria bacterium RBG_16_52_11 TaxID=1798374 RepID=A0A1F5YVC5_9BACT|nr:MAG: tryptophan--tRNA ligase [Candidatus Gottesmanbacteria bacterium RBG_16_52_11]
MDHQIQGIRLNGRRILSGITPSGDGTLHIGNYLGAVRQFIEIAKSNQCFLFVADLHALTTVQDRKALERNTETLILNELALLAGLGSLENITFFRQSDVPLHAELQSVLNNVTPVGFLRRAHAYKDKLAKETAEDEINLGLFNYPILMAADILLYKPDYVPVGRDQKQHIEITRDIADRFNRTFGKQVFKLPEPYIPEEVAVVLGTDGKRKMSKSLGNIISIFEPEEEIKKQVMSTYTDPKRIHADDPGHTEGNMVFAYLEFFGDKKKVADLKAKYTEGKVADVEVKEYLFESLMKTFRPAREKYRELKSDRKQVQEILESGAAKARITAAETMKAVREAAGLTNQYSFFRYEFARTDGMISIDEFARTEIRVGKVEKAENVEKSDKLIRLTVDLGESGKRNILTGVRGFGYTPEYFSGKQFLFVTNLEYRKMMGEESQGMILAVDGLELPFGEHGEAKPVFIPAEDLPIGAKVR